jgi:hypothetical protein
MIGPHLSNRGLDWLSMGIAIASLVINGASTFFTRRRRRR